MQKVSQTDKAATKAEARTSDGWMRRNMRKVHVKGRRTAKKLARRARRRVDKAAARQD